MTSGNLTFLAFAICSIATITILLPSIVYFVTEWRSRRDQLFQLLDEEALNLYYQKFRPAFQCPKDKDINDCFKENFHSLYGRRHYVIPLILLAIIVALGMWSTATTIRVWLVDQNSTLALPPVVISAFLGAYVWVLFDQFSRYRNRNFTNHDIYNGVYRFLIIVPLGLSFSALLRPEVGIPIVFLLGTFPTQTLIKFGRRLVVEKGNLGEQEKDGPTELAQLQGIGVENAERFQDIGLSTIVGLAWCDPIEVTIRTNFEFNYVIDCISQALVWVYFEEDTKELYRFSLRGAQEAKYLWDSLDSDNPKTKLAAEKTLEEIAVALKMSPVSLRHTLDVIADDPYSDFLSRIWGGKREE